MAEHRDCSNRDVHFAYFQFVLFVFFFSFITKFKHDDNMITMVIINGDRKGNAGNILSFSYQNITCMLFDLTI